MTCNIDSDDSRQGADRLNAAKIPFKSSADAEHKTKRGAFRSAGESNSFVFGLLPGIFGIGALACSALSNPVYGADPAPAVLQSKTTAALRLAHDPASLQRKQDEYEKHKIEVETRQQAFRDKVAAQSIQECIHDLTSTSDSSWAAIMAIGIANPESPSMEERTFQTILAEPSVAKLLQYGGESQAHRQEVIDLLTPGLRDMLEKYALYSPNEHPVSPSASSPGGVTLYPYILSRLRAVETFPLLVACAQRMQEGLRASMRHEVGKIHPERASGFDPQYIHGSNPLIFAEAFDYFMTSADLGLEKIPSLTSEQKAILTEYRTFHDGPMRLDRDRHEAVTAANKTNPHRIYQYQSEVLSYAQRFVNAGAAKPDEKALKNPAGTAAK